MLPPYCLRRRLYGQGYRSRCSWSTREVTIRLISPPPWFTAEAKSILWGEVDEVKGSAGIACRPAGGLGDFGVSVHLVQAQHQVA